MASPFAHLHVHSHYSLMRGTERLEALAEAARQRGMDRFALTDTNALYGFVFYRQICDEWGLKPIAGAEVLESAASGRGAAPGEGPARAVLLARGRDGYRSLCHVLTARHLDPNFSLEHAVREHASSLVLLSEQRPLLSALRDALPVYAELVPGRDDRPLLHWARKQELACVATNDVHFVDRAHHRLHHTLRAIARNTTLDRVPRADLAEPERSFLSASEMEGRFPHAPEALENAARLARECEADWPMGKTVFPSYPLERGEAFEILRARCEAGILHRYGRDPSPEVLSRLDRELAIIRDKGFADYFLIVEAITSRTPRICGRGSGAASIVAYLLGITHVDPVRHNLFFERFLSPIRKDPPDIDVDFAWDERDQIQLDVLAENGAPVRAAMVANHVGFRAKAAIHEIAKVYGLPEAEIMNVTRRLQGHWGVEDPIDGMSGRARFRDVDFEPPWPEILAQAEALDGHPRHLAVHSGGIVIVPGELADHVPVEIAPKGVPIVQWEKDQVEEFGLVKMDLLGNRSLAVIRDALQAVERNAGLEIDERSWNPIDDPATQRLMAAGDTIGVFYAESSSMRQLQRKAGKGDFDHLVIHSSMIRPAANSYIQEYVRRLRGGAYDPLHPALRHTLDETYGIMCYQEDITKVSMELAGLSLAEAEGMRKALGQKRPVKPLREYMGDFYAGASARGVDREVIDKVWHMILSFAGYSFCKPHSASYALVSFRSGWLRAHYPAEFMAAVITNQGGYYDTFAYVSEARRMGLRVLPPDVNQSAREYAGREREMRIGLMQIKGLHAEAIAAVLRERERAGPFASFEDLTRRVALHFSDAELLVKAGACDSIARGRTRAELLWSLYLEAGAVRATGTLDLFAPQPLAVPHADAYDKDTMLRHEVETLGFLWSVHPLAPYERALRGRGAIAAKDLDRHVGERISILGWHVTSKLVHDKNERLMEFIGFEDTTAIYDATFFADAYERFCHLLATNRPFLLTGRVEEDFGVCSLRVEKLERLPWP
ncbi:MAG TPA: DNA polymerase III subunit alpha [Candidatus Dormibacteraeota bacterium]|nr:DNA polymerase III subunit alpha [Candidatus Dormibacteraeota bacterium]